jgi:8-oxo-dGTP diphosphatase
MKLLGVFEAQAHGKPEGTIVHATCYTADFKGDARPSSEIAEIAWLSYKDMGKVPPLGKVVFEWVHERGMLA